MDLYMRETSAWQPMERNDFIVWEIVVLMPSINPTLNLNTSWRQSHSSRKKELQTQSSNDKANIDFILYNNSIDVPHVFPMQTVFCQFVREEEEENQMWHFNFYTFLFIACINWSKSVFSAESIQN